MYRCKRCGKEAKVVGIQEVDQYENPCIVEMVVCGTCEYEVLKDTMDKDDLLTAVTNALTDLERAEKAKDERNVTCADIETIYFNRAVGRLKAVKHCCESR